jgi:putative flippase GtrA
MWGKVLRFLIVGTTVAVLYFALCYIFRAGLELSPFFATLAAYPIYPRLKPTLIQRTRPISP